MSEETHLLKAAIELTEALHKAVDENMPKKLAGIVKMHSALAVGSAFVPIPGVDVVAAGTNIWAMYVRINKELQLPFAENVLKSIAAGAVTNISGAAIGFIVVGSVLKFIPGLGSLGGAAVMGTTIYAVTLASGIVYMKAITRLLRSKKVGEVTASDLKSATNEILKDKEHLKTILEEGKAAYQNRDDNSEKMKSCPQCGRQYPPTESFCAFDGIRLV